MSVIEREMNGAEGMMYMESRSPAAGHAQLTLTFEALTFPADDGLVLVAYDAEPASASAEALSLLSAWAATPADANKGP